MWLYKVGGAGWKEILPEQRSVLLGTGLEDEAQAPACGPTHPCPGPQAADAGVKGSCRLGEKTGQRQVWLGLQEGIKMQGAGQKGQSAIKVFPD